MLKTGDPGEWTWSEFYNFWIITLNISHAMILATVTCLCSFVLGTKENEVKHNVHVVAYNWVFPSGKCDVLIDGDCGRSVYDVRSLGSNMIEGEESASGLFSSVNAPFLVLAGCVVSTCFSICMLRIRNQDGVDRNVNFFALLLLVVYGFLFLFVQKDWNIPANNLFVVEAIYVVVFIFVNTYSIWNAHMYYAFKILNIVFTFPLTAVAILSLTGEDNAVNLMQVFFSLLAGFCVILVANNEMSIREDGIFGYYLVFFWCCLGPFIIYSGARFHFLLIESPIPYPRWSIGALSLMFVSYICDAVGYTLQLSILKHERFDIAGTYLKLGDIIMKYSIQLLVVVGFYIEFHS